MQGLGTTTREYAGFRDYYKGVCGVLVRIHSPTPFLLALCLGGLLGYVHQPPLSKCYGVYCRGLNN